MKMDYAPDLESAMDAAMALRGNDEHIVVMPDGISVVPER